MTIPTTEIPCLEQSVLGFISRCSDEIGKYERGAADQNLWSALVDNDPCCESPIEQILYCALETIRRLNGIDDAEPFEIQGEDYCLGVGIYPQRSIGKYRVDFMVSHHFFVPGGHRTPGKRSVIVECDSQQFHERSERERRYEKARDRFFATQGYHVFHFTGSEILREPFRVAAEVIAYVTNDSIENIFTSGDPQDL